MSSPYRTAAARPRVPKPMPPDILPAHWRELGWTTYEDAAEHYAWERARDERAARCALTDYQRPTPKWGRLSTRERRPRTPTIPYHHSRLGGAGALARRYGYVSPAIRLRAVGGAS